MRLDHQANGCTLVNIQSALLYQIGVDRSVKPSVINDIVDMAVHIVVCPACGDALELKVSRSWLGGGTLYWLHDVMGLLDLPSDF